MKTWQVVLEGIQPKIEGNILRFSPTQELRARKGKILAQSWMQTIRKNVETRPNYRILEGVRSVISPDGKDFGGKAFFLVISDRVDTPPEYVLRSYRVASLVAFLMKRVGLLCGISTGNEIGVFGMWPTKFYETCKNRPDLMVVVEVFLADCPDFWESVQIIVSPAMGRLLGRR